MTKYMFIYILLSFLSLSSCLSISDSDQLIKPIGYLEKDSTEDESVAIVIPSSDYVFEDTSKLDLITDADDTEQPTKIANYDYSMHYVTIVYEGKKYMVAVPTDDIEDFDDEEKAELALDVQKETTNGYTPEVVITEEDDDDVLGLAKYIYAGEQIYQVNSTSSNATSNVSALEIQTQEIDKLEQTEITIFQSFFEYFGRKSSIERRFLE